MNDHIYFAFPRELNQKVLPKQGFKLHVSATIVNAISVAKKVIPYLLQKKINFKIIKNLYILADMNHIALMDHRYHQLGHLAFLLKNR